MNIILYQAMTSTEIEMQDSKRRLRKEIRNSLAGFQRVERREASCKIVQLIAGLNVWRSATGVLAYAPIPDEPDITPLLAAFSGSVHLPVVNNNEVMIRPFTPDAAIVPGERGNLEPDTDEFSNLETIEIALVPGRAFTAGGLRLGRGGGHYDRILTKLPENCLLVGIGFALQLLDAVPQQAHDIVMHAVVTEYGVYSKHPLVAVD